MSKRIMMFLLLVIVAILSGCVGKGVQNVMDYKDTQTDVAMSETIFLSPTDAPRIVYLQVQNTSNNLEAKNTVSNIIVSQIEALGYLVVNKPSSATYILQVAVRYIGEYKEGMNFGGTLTGATAGALSGVGLTSNYSHIGRNTVAGGLIGAAVGLAFDVMTRTKTYVALIDFQLTEVLTNHSDFIGQTVKKSQTVANLKDTGGLGSQINSTEMTTTSREVSSSKKGVKIYTAAVAAKAKKLVVKGGDPTDELLRKAAAQIAGIF